MTRRGEGKAPLPPVADGKPAGLGWRRSGEPRRRGGSPGGPWGGRGGTGIRSGLKIRSSREDEGSTPSARTIHSPGRGRTCLTTRRDGWRRALNRPGAKWRVSSTRRWMFGTRSAGISEPEPRPKGVMASDQGDRRDTGVTGAANVMLPSVTVDSVGVVNVAVETTASASDAILTGLDDTTLFRISEGDERAIPESLRAFSPPLVKILAKQQHTNRQRASDRVHAFWTTLLVGLICTALGVLLTFIITL